MNTAKAHYLSLALPLSAPPGGRQTLQAANVSASLSTGRMLAMSNCPSRRTCLRGKRLTKVHAAYLKRVFASIFARQWSRKYTSIVGHGS